MYVIPKFVPRSGLQKRSLSSLGVGKLKLKLYRFCGFKYSQFSDEKYSLCSICGLVERIVNYTEMVREPTEKEITKSSRKCKDNIKIYLR